MKDELLKLLKDEKLMERGREISKKFAERLIKDPMDVGRIFDDLISEIFELSMEKVPDVAKSMGIEIPSKETLMGQKDKFKKLFNNLLTLEILFLMLHPKEVNNEFSSKIDNLFEKCKAKDSERLKNIFHKPRVELLRKFQSSWKRSWRDLFGPALPEEARIDNKFKAAKSLSEGLYRELLIVIQEITQIVFDFKPTKHFGMIIDQFEKNTSTNVFVNRTAYNIRNAESHENIVFENGGKVELFDENNQLIQSVNEEDLDKTISWLTSFTESVTYSLQRNYLEFINVKPDNRAARLVELFDVFFDNIF